MNARIQVLAHRGLVSSSAPENSLKAFSDALAVGADVIETDVQCSKDGIAIIFHDADLKRICRLDARVSDLSFDELQNLDIGSKQKIPSLEQALKEFPAARFNLDIKSSAAISATARVINQLKVHDRVLISSFSESRRRKTLRAIAGPIATSAGVSRVLAIYFSIFFRLNALTKFLTKGLTALQLPPQSGLFKFDSPLFISAIKQSGIQLHFWTINDVEQMISLAKAGADGIVTDYCDLAISKFKMQK